MLVVSTGVSAHLPTSDSRLVLSTEYMTAAQLRASSADNHVLGVMALTPAVGDIAGLERVPVCAVGFDDWDEGNERLEVWFSANPVRYSRRDNLALADDGDVLMGIVSFADTQTELEEKTQATYRRILDACESEGYPHLFRIWNFIPNINRPTASGMERYRAFCKGRALAFFDDRHCAEKYLPAGTGVGSRGGPVSICFLAARAEVPVNLENCRQVPAYRYPRIYGPKSPSFARGTFLRLQDEDIIFVSGTSSIVGHETLHPGDIEKQCRTSLENIRVLLSSENLGGYNIQAQTDLACLDLIKVYIRHQADVARVKQICREYFSPRARVLYLGADICRSDLLVEIEGCALLRTT